MKRELGPDSPWIRALQPETAVADLAKFKDAPLYRYELTYDPEAHLLSGTNKILYTNLSGRPLDTLYLAVSARTWGDAKNEDDRFSISDLRVDGAPHQHTMHPHGVTIPLERTLAPGKSVTLSFGMRATLPRTAVVTSGSRDYPSSGGLYGYNPGYADGLDAALPLVVGDDDASERIEKGVGFFYRPSLFDLRITLPAAWQVISSGTTVSETPAEGDRTTARVVGLGLRFGLYVSRTFESVSAQAGQTRVTCYFPANQRGAVQGILADAVQALATNQALLGPHPYPEMKLFPALAVGSVAGMNVAGGLIVLSASAYSPPPALVPPSFTDPFLRKALSAAEFSRQQILFHEAAHSWWGHLVLSDMVKQPLWAEGLTEATAIAAVERARGQEDADRYRTWASLRYQHFRRVGYADLPVGLPVPDPLRISDYMAMSYSKPALFYDRVRQQMGDGAFWRAVRGYIDANRFTMKTDRGPVEALIAADPAVEALYRRWLMEAHGDEDLGVLTDDQAKALGLSK